MKPNRPTTTGISPPSFTHATRCTVPQSSPLLSSSFTPFYPRSQQQLYHPLHPGFVSNCDGGCQVSAQHSDEIGADQSHVSSWSDVRDQRFYDQQYYASLGVEPYGVSWFSNDGTVWDGGEWQQWGDPVEYAYGEEDAAVAANLFSDSLSYYAGSPAIEQDTHACPTTNSTSRPVPFPQCDTQFLSARVNENSEAALKPFSAAMPNVSHSIVRPEQVSCAKGKTESAFSSFGKSNEQAVSGCGESSAKSERKEVASEFSGSKFEAKLFSMQVPMQTSSDFSVQDGELKSIAEMPENIQTRTKGTMLLKASNNLSKDQGFVEVIESKHSMSVGLSSSDANESINSSSFRPSTSHPAAEMMEKEVQSMKGVPHHNNISHSQSSCVSCPSMTLPKHVDPQALEQVNLEGLCQEKVNPGFNDPGDDIALSEPHLLVECIHNLSKVLLCSQSKASLNVLNSSDCFSVENAIYMLSHRLLQCTMMEAIVHQQPVCQQIAEERLGNSGDSTKDISQPSSLKKDSNMNPIFSLQRDFQKGDLENALKFVTRTVMGGDDEKLSLKKHLEVAQEELRTLRDDFRKLQEEVGYERADSNVMVSTFKKLWSEAVEALTVSRSLEIREIRTELAGLKEELTNLKHSRGTPKHCEINDSGKEESFSDIVSSSSQGLLALDLNRALTPDRNYMSTGSSNKASEVLTGYFDLGITLNCRKGEASLNTLNSGSKHSNLEIPFNRSSKFSESSTSKPLLNPTIVSPLIPDGDVTRQLSLPSFRQGLNSDKTIKKADLMRSNLVISSDHTSKNSELSTGTSLSNHNTKLPEDLEGGVARRLSVLLSRQGLDLNKTCIESSVEWPSKSGTIIEPSGEGEAAPANRKYLLWSETSYLGKDTKELGCLPITNLSCGKTHVSEIEDGHCGLVEQELDKGVKGSASQEDEIEIICFKPGMVDSNFTCLKGEPEWEDVVVNALDDHISIKSDRVLSFER